MRTSCNFAIKRLLPVELMMHIVAGLYYAGDSGTKGQLHTPCTVSQCSKRKKRILCGNNLLDERSQSIIVPAFLFPPFQSTRCSEI